MDLSTFDVFWLWLFFRGARHHRHDPNRFRFARLAGSGCVVSVFGRLREGTHEQSESIHVTSDQRAGNHSCGRR